MGKNERNYYLLNIYYLLLAIDQSCEIDINRLFFNGKTEVQDLKDVKYLGQGRKHSQTQSVRPHLKPKQASQNLHFYK